LDPGGRHDAHAELPLGIPDAGWSDPCRAHNDIAGTFVLGIAGHLDSRSLIGLEAQLDQLKCLAFDEVVIDIEKLRSIDATGFASLVRLCRHVASRGREVRIVAGDEPCDLPTSFRRLARRARNNRLFDRAQKQPRPDPRRLGTAGLRGTPGLRGTAEPGLTLGD
jgi:ABC-type transporter Mla MlaB component